MPISQTLLLSIFPKEKHAQATGIWAMTTIVAPILGPILGGTISDNWGWHWIFFINIPIAAICVAGTLALLRKSETKTDKAPIDTIGLILLVVWIGALQIMLDLGREQSAHRAEKPRLRAPPDITLGETFTRDGLAHELVLLLKPAAISSSSSFRCRSGRRCASAR